MTTVLLHSIVSTSAQFRHKDWIASTHCNVSVSDKEHTCWFRSLNNIIIIIIIIIVAAGATTTTAAAAAAAIVVVVVVVVNASISQL